MKIKYSGKFINQYKEAKERKEEIFRLYPEYFEEFSYILGIKPNETKNINIRKKREEIFYKYKSYDEEIKKSFQDLIFYNSIKHSFNKNKGTWLEDYLKELFSNNTKFFKIEDSNPWKDNLINKHFLRVPIKINKNYSAFSVFPLKFKEFKKIKISLDYNPTKYLEILYNKGVSDYFDISLDIDSKIKKDYFNFFVNLKLKKELSNEKLINLLYEIGILEKSVDMSKKKTDVTFKDLKNNNLIILEVKNYEDTLISNKEVNQAVAYGLREKYFNNKKFKTVKLVYIGSFKEGLVDYIEKVNNNLYKNESFKIELINFNDFIEDLKINYFDDEDKKNYRRDTYCFNLDTWIIENKHKGDSFIKSKYKKYGVFRNNKDYIEFIADFEFEKKELNLKDIVLNEKNNKKREIEENAINKIAYRRFER